MVDQISIPSYTMIKKIVLHLMTPEAILKDEFTKASKMKNQEQTKSENQIVANKLEKHKKRSDKSVHDNKNEIKLKGACFIATKSDLDEIDATTAVCYALICKQTLFSLQDIPLSLPPVVTNLLQEMRCFSKGGATGAATNSWD